jgi:hypothetical protein
MHEHYLIFIFKIWSNIEREMGQQESKDRILFTEILCSVLCSTGCKMSKSQLERFLSYVQNVCPWFPDEGTVNLKTWERVGQRIKDYYSARDLLESL